MKRIAAPMIGGMVSDTILTLIVVPAVYGLWKGIGLQNKPFVPIHEEAELQSSSSINTGM